MTQDPFDPLANDHAALPIVALADDFSGACELTQAASARGLSTAVQTKYFHQPVDVICVDIGTRFLSPERAAARVTDISQTILGTSIRWLFYRVDALRPGHAAEELSAIFSNGWWNRIMVIPVRPSLGIGISKLDIVGTSTKFNEWAVAATNLKQMGNVRIPDIEDRESLTHLASAVDDYTLLAGSVDFFCERMVPFSRNRTTRVQRGRFSGRRLLIVTNHDRIPDLPSTVPCFSPKSPIGIVLAALSTNRLVVLSASQGTSSADLVDVGSMVRELLQRQRVEQVLIEGDAYGRMILDACSCSRFSVHFQLGEGILGLRSEIWPLATMIVKPPHIYWPRSIAPPVSIKTKQIRL